MFLLQPRVMMFTLSFFIVFVFIINVGKGKEKVDEGWFEKVTSE